MQQTASLNIKRPATGRTIGQNLKLTLKRVQAVPKTTGTGLIR
jgi:hypothetical protein